MKPDEGHLPTAYERDGKRLRCGITSEIFSALAGDFIMKASHVQQFFDQARAFLIGRMSAARAKFDLHSFDDYEYDLTEKRFWWLNRGVRQLEASLIVVGSFSTQSQTWLWAWANRQLDAVRTPELEPVREFGARFEISCLTEPAWQAQDDDGWAMTAMSAKLLGATCAYRCPISNGFLFVLLNDLRKTPGNGEMS